MTTVKVIGAGSIGNHLAHGCRQQGWDVTIVDLSSEALERTRDTIYPSRYGSWDKDITLATPDTLGGQGFDIVIIGTPPATHLTIATAELQSNPPQVLLIEKPLSHPDQSAIRAFVELASASPTRVLVGYNQRYKRNTLAFLEKAKSLNLGKLQGLRSHMLESWDGILNAHFWMDSEKDSYLAFTEQGGGALLEHSHALNLFLLFANELDQGQAISVEATIDWVDHDAGLYDREATLAITFASGLSGEVRQNLYTWPAVKEAEAVFENGVLIWAMGSDSDSVTHRATSGELIESWNYPKTRPDDFEGEIAHLGELLANPTLESTLDLSHGLHVMEVALAAFESSATNRAISLETLK